MSKEIEHVRARSSVHFGQNYWNTATYAGILRMIIKSLAEQQGIKIDDMDKELKDDKIVWWLGDSFKRVTFQVLCKIYPCSPPMREQGMKSIRK